MIKRFYMPSMQSLPIACALRLPIILALLVALHLQTQAQDEPVIVLKGIIKDATTGEAIPYATVSLTVNGITTLSNEEGQFIFKIPASHRHDTVYISHVGYRSITLPTAPGNASSIPDTTTRVITLNQEPVQLPGVTVKPIDPLTMIDKAIARIGDNYPTRPFVSLGFYRLDGTYHGKIADISEAVFDISSPDNQRKNMQFRLIKARADRDISTYDGREYSLGFKPDNIMDRDMVSRIHETEILGDQGRNDHAFTYGGLVDYEGAAAYEILFDQKDDIQTSKYKGRIIIDTANLAFLCFDYGRSPKGLSYLPRGNGPWFNDRTSTHLVIKYRRYGSKYYLDQVSIFQGIHSHYDGNPPIDFDTMQVRINYLVTRIDTGVVAFSKVGKKIKDNTNIEKQVRENDPGNVEYWENYNSIAADYNVDSALAVIRANNIAYRVRKK
jgi:hypothetical protein